MIHIFFKEPYYVFYWNEETGKVKIISNSINKSGKEITIYTSVEGYLKAKVNNKSLVIHQFIGEKLFGPKIEGMVINHKDCNKLNNSKSNLEYITIAENIKHAIVNGNHPACNPKRSGRYIDGRTVGDRKKKNKYKRQWFIAKQIKING